MCVTQINLGITKQRYTRVDTFLTTTTQWLIDKYCPPILFKYLKHDEMFKDIKDQLYQLLTYEEASRHQFRSVLANIVNIVYTTDLNHAILDCFEDIIISRMAVM